MKKNGLWKKGKRCVESLVITTALIIGSITFPAGSEVHAEPVSISFQYWNQNGYSEDSITEYNTVEASAEDVTWDGGYYVVPAGNITISGTAVVSGNVNLILCDGCNLTVTGGIRVNPENSIAIFSQSFGANQGKMTATGANQCAGIGSETNSGQPGRGNNGDITIHGGVIHATGGNPNTAGIGGGFGENCGNITIHGGNVTADGNYNGAGIGSGGSCSTGSSSANITITGGTVKATGYHQGAGIGGGAGGNSGTITISGGNVTAIGKYSAAGIGGAAGSTPGNADDITISGGIVTATCEEGGAGIGGGFQGSIAAGKHITITGGIITAKGEGDDAEDIGKGESSEDNTEGKVLLNRGIVNGVVYGEMEINDGLTDLEEIKFLSGLQIPEAAGLNVAEEKKITVTGVLEVAGELELSGILNVSGITDLICEGSIIRRIMLDDGSGLISTDPIPVEYGQPMPEIEAPTMSGKSFQGYFTQTAGAGLQYYKADGSSARDCDKPLLGFSKLYAKWGTAGSSGGSTVYYSSTSNEPKVTTVDNGDGTKTVTTTYPDGLVRVEIMDSSGTVLQKTETTVTTDSLAGTKTTMVTVEKQDGSKAKTITTEYKDGSKEIIKTTETADGSRESYEKKEDKDGNSVETNEVTDPDGTLVEKKRKEVTKETDTGITTTTEIIETADGKKETRITKEGKDGILEVTLIKEGADGSKETTVTKENTDGSKETTVTKEGADGSKETTVTKENTDGSKETTVTKEGADGSKETTVTKENTDGSKETTVTKEGTDGSKETTEIKEGADGSKETTVTKEHIDGSKETTVTKEKTDGGKEVTETVENADGSSVIHREVTDREGTLTEKATVEVKTYLASGTKVTTGTKEYADGSKETTVTEEKSDGSKEVTLTKENADGSSKISCTKKNADGSSEITHTKRNVDGSTEFTSEKEEKDGSRELTLKKEIKDGTVSDSTVNLDSKGKVTGIVIHEKTKTGESTVPYQLQSDGTVAMGKVKTTEKTFTISGKIIPANKKTYKVTEIADEALLMNKIVKKITMADSIKKIGKRAFKKCNKLKTVKFSSQLTDISEEAFSGCKNMTSVSLPSGVRKLGKGCFKNCTKLKKLVLGIRKKGGLQNQYGNTGWGTAVQISIAASALENCVNLKQVIINSQVTKIGDAAFRKCKNLVKIIIYSLVLKKVGKKALTGVSNCKINVPKVKIKPYKILFKNKGQGKKVVVAKM